MARSKWVMVIVPCVVVTALFTGGCGTAPGPAPTPARDIRKPAPADPAPPAAKTPIADAPEVPTAAPAPANYEIEYMLACIEAGHRVERNDFRVALFDSLLDSLEAKTVNSRSNIADIIVKTSQLAAEDGMPIGVLAVAQALDISIPPDAASLGMKLEEVAAVWLVLYLAGG